MTFTPPAEMPWVAPPVPRRSLKVIITIVLLAGALAATLAIFIVYFLKLDEANTRIDEQNQQIQEQQNLIDEKETFGAAMNGLLDTASSFDGTLMSSLVPFHDYELYVRHAWTHRWDAAALAGDVDDVAAASEHLEGVLAAATTEASTNTTGTTYETVLDQLSGGFATALIDDADTICGADVLACVLTADPFTVHFDVVDSTVPYMNDELRTGITYHEFAHVLQMSNHDPTETALEAFGGDNEIMADCFALTYLDGWKLNHTIRVNSYQYWDVSIGYGYTCNEAQRQVIRDWYGQLGFHSQSISQ